MIVELYDVFRTSCQARYRVGVTEEFEPQGDELELATVLAALADPARLATVKALAHDGGEMQCALLRDIAGAEITKSTMSHHFKVLRESGLTRTRVAGVHRYLTLRRDDLDAAFPGLLDAVIGDPARAAAKR